MNSKDIDHLIERYFDGLTTLDEERRLRRALADPTLGGEAVEAARAVMGVFAAQRKASQRPAARKLHAWRVAAGLALLIAATATFVLVPREAQPEPCYLTYTEGALIDDSEQVLALMQSDLGAMADAAESVNRSVDDDFDEIISAINL